MILSIPDLSPRADKVHVVRDNECETWRSDYTERKAGVPQVLLVEQKIPGSQILPHFHTLDQFQVFMDETGRLGSHAVKPIAIHYTNSYTGYGPIVAGEGGFSYYVLRPEFDVKGSHYLHVPEARAKMTRGGKRVLLAEGVTFKVEDQNLSKLTAPQVDRVLGAGLKADDPDAGVFVDAISLGPEMRYQGCDPLSGGGQVFMVVKGSASYGDQKLAGRSSVAITRDEPAVTLIAGGGGAQILMFQYPRRA